MASKNTKVTQEGVAGRGNMDYEEEEIVDVDVGPAARAVDPRKRKAVDSNRVIQDNRAAPPAPTNLKEYVHSLRQLYPSIAGASQINARLLESPRFGYEIATSNYIQDLRAFRSMILPMSGGVDFARDEKGFITTISDEDSTVSGDLVIRLCINYGAALRGMGLVVYKEAVDRRDWSGLVIPAFNVAPYSVKLEEVEIIGKTFYSSSGSMNLILPHHDVLHVTSIEGLPLASFPGVLKSLSALRKVNNKYDVIPLIDLATVTLARSDQDLKKLTVAFLETIQAALLYTSDIEKRAAAFVHNPTLSFLAKLGIKRPFSRPLLDAHQKPVKTVALSSLPTTSQILVQDLSIDGHFYDKKLSLGMPVYTPGDYFMKVGKGPLRKLEPVSLMSAGALQTIVRAKEAAMVAPKKVEPAPRGDSNKEGGVEASSNALTFDI